MMLSEKEYCVRMPRQSQKVKKQKNRSLQGIKIRLSMSRASTSFRSSVFAKFQT